MTNLIQNPTGVGASIGVITIPPPVANGLYSAPPIPDDWIAYAPGAQGHGMTFEVTGTGVETGIHYVEFRYHGTHDGSDINLNVEIDFTNIDVTPGEVYSLAFYCKLVAGAWPSGETMRLQINEFSGPFDPAFPFNNGLTFPNAPVTPVKQPGLDYGAVYSGGLWRPTDADLNTQLFAMTFPPIIDAITHMQPSLNFYFASGETVDLTFRIGHPMLWLGEDSPFKSMWPGQSAKGRQWALGSLI